MVIEIANENILALSKCCYAIAGVVAIVNALAVYVRMNNEKSVDLLIAKTMFICSLLVALGVMLKLLVTT